MTVRRRLKAATAITIVLAQAILTILLVTDRGVEGSLAKAGIADRVIAGIFELNILTQSFILRPQEERPREQWLMRDASLRKLIAQIGTKDDQEKEVLSRVLEANKEASKYFSELVAFQDKQTETSGEGEPTQQEIERLSNQLISRTQLMVIQAMRLKELSNASIYANRRFSFQLVFGSALALILVALASSLSLWRNIGGGLRELEQGTAMLKVGNLDYRLPAKRSDELGRLAQAFNDMATKLKESYDQVRQARDELEERVEQRTSELSKKTRQLEAAVKELEAFSYSVSHDLRSPLRAIAGFTRMILNENGSAFDQETRRKFDVVQENALKMGRLIDDLLRLSRLGRAELSRSKIDMESLVGEALREVRMAEPDRELITEIGPLPKTHGDSAMIRQLLINLLSNAVKFTRGKPNARIEVGAIEKSGAQVYYVRDNGVGFEMEYYDKLFGVFQRLVSDSEFEGTGVGLAIVKRIVQRHGGRVWAEGKLDEGATFYFELPQQEQK